MSRRTSARGYLQQLAQPIAPGETVLTARPGVATHAAEAGPVVPVIEDHFEVPARGPSTRGAARLRAEWPVVNQDSMAPATEAAQRSGGEDAILPQPANVAARVTAPGPKVNATDARPHERLTATVSAHAGTPEGDSPIEASQKTSANVQSDMAHPLRAVTSRMLADRREPSQARTPESSSAEASTAHPRVRSYLRTAEDSTAKQLVAENKDAKDAPPSQSAGQDYFTKRTAIDPAAEAVLASRVPEQKGKPEVNAGAGPRVHIGTVEIRMALPKTPAPLAAAPATSPPQSNAAMQARGRSGLAEPLARGLEWSYGLVQG